MSKLFQELAAPGVQKLQPYLPGKPVEELERELGIGNAIKLASNENPLGCSPRAAEAIRAAAAQVELYPDANAYYLKQRLAQKLGIGERQITIGNGSNDVLDLIERRMRTIAEATCAAFDARCEFEFRRNYPSTYNHPAETAFLRRLLSEVAGEDNVLDFQPTMGAEDFSYFLLEKPGCYFLIGNGTGNHRAADHGAGPCLLHNPSYDFNDELIAVGASAWVRVVEGWFAQDSPSSAVTAR